VKVDDVNLMASRYNFSSKAVSEVQSEDVDGGVESWRNELDVAMKDYVKNYYPQGVYSVSTDAVGACC